MRVYRRSSTVGQMAVAVGVFVVAGLLLESGGLLDWAQRLDLGPERTVAVPVATALHRGLGRLGLERLRQTELVELARVGWSDDPAALAEAGRSPAPAVAKHESVTPPATPAAATTPTTLADLPRRPLKPMAGDPPLLSRLPAPLGLPEGRQRTVALAGDSMMAVGISSTMLRQATQYKDLSLVKAFKSGTGLARPEVFDWQTEYPAMLKDARPDLVVVAIGANDGQGFVQDGVTYPFGSDGWKEIYQRRVEAFLQMLQSGGATVVWLGLPPMKSSGYDARIALVNRIDYAVVSASPHAVWFSTAGLVGGEDGRFEDFGEVSGHTVRLRQADGIHLSDDGAVLVVAKLLPWLAGEGRE